MFSIKNALSPGFESLPPDILLAIIKQLPELVSLDSLLRASPSSARLFTSHGTEITDAVLSAGYIHGHIRAIVRIIALIRTSKLPMNNLHEFQEKTTFAAMTQRIISLRIHLSPLYLEPDTPPHILRGILASYRHITNLSLRFIKVLLKRFRALQPRRLINPSKCPTDLFTLRKVPKEQTEAYTVPESGPPYWEEEQRAIRVFWRVQLLHDIKKAATKGRLVGWSREDIKAIMRMGLIKFYGAHWSIQNDAEAHPEYDELCSLEAYLCGTLKILNLTKISDTSYFKPPYPPVEVQRQWPTPTAPDSQFLPWKGKRKMAKWLIYPAPACWAYFHQFPTYARTDVPFQFFGKFGFAFWNWDRMKEFGLLPDAIWYGRMDAPFTYRWLSLLEEPSTDLINVGEKLSPQYSERVILMIPATSSTGPTECLPP